MQAISALSREAAKVLPSLACLLFGLALALHVLYGEGSSLLEGTDYTVGEGGQVFGEELGDGAYVEGFQTFGLSCGTVLAAALGNIGPPYYGDVP